MEDFNFKVLLSVYEDRLDFVRRMSKDSDKDPIYWEGYLDGIFSLFETLKMYLPDSVIPMRNELTEEEKKEFFLDENFPLIAIIDYRGHKIPVYDDDYGQTMFTRINGKDYSGGTYNLFPESEFEYLMDSYLDIQKR